MEKLKYELEMDHQMRMNKRNNYIQDSKAYFNDELNRKKRMEEMKFTERYTKIPTSYNMKEIERMDEYKRKLLKMNENIEKNCDSYLDFNNSNKNSFYPRYGNRELYQQIKNPNISIFKYKYKFNYDYYYNYKFIFIC
jgi:hypothetical protein